jgi:hypothetical protein
MKMKNRETGKVGKETAKNKIRNALVLLGSATIMGTYSCGAVTPEGNTTADGPRESRLFAESLQESTVVLSSREGGSKLRAEVVVYEPGETASDPVNIRDVMEEIVSTCQDTAELQTCIYREAIERTGEVRGTILPNAQVEFQYWSAERGVWEEIAVGTECDISNYVPSLIRATFTPGINSGISPSSATYRMPSLDSD